jgi:6-phosphogluconolactonase (cycloisomerase 2 family)
LTQVSGSPFAAGTGPSAATSVQRGARAALYVTNAGSNNVSGYLINNSTGALTALPGSPFGAGTGPDGVSILDIGGTYFAYVANYGSDNVSAYAISAKTGALTQVAGSPFAAGTGPFGLAGIVVNDGNTYLYAANEGSDNVSAYTVNSSSGALTAVTGSPFATGSGPIGVSCVQKGREGPYLYATNSGSNNVSGYSIDASSGALTQVKGSPFSAATEPYGIDGVPHSGKTVDSCG